MVKVELHPAILFHCNFCSEESWHNCTMRTGLEALSHMLGNMEAAMNMEKFVRHVQKRCAESNMRCPPLPDFKSTISINASFRCKNCENAVGSMKAGYVFACDDCGRDNYILSKKGLEGVQCQYCGSSFETESVFDN